MMDVNYIYVYSIYTVQYLYSSLLPEVKFAANTSNKLMKNRSINYIYINRNNLNQVTDMKIEVREVILKADL